MSDMHVVKDARVRAEQEPARREGERLGPRFEVRSNMRVVAEPAHPRAAPIGSVDLRSLRYPAEASENWGRGVRLQDCVVTISAAIDEIADCFVEVIGDGDGDLGREIDDLVEKVAEIGRRLECVERDNAALAERNAGLTREIELLGRLNAEPARKAAKRTAASAKRKPSGGVTIEAAPGAGLAQ